MSNPQIFLLPHTSNEAEEVPPQHSQSCHTNTHHSTHCTTTQATVTLTNDEKKRVVRYARNELVRVIIQSGEIFHDSDTCDRKIKHTIKQGLCIVAGGAVVQQPKSMQKDIVQHINKLLHPWKDKSLLYALTVLRGQDGQQTPPTVAEKAKTLLNTLSFL